MRCCKWKLIIHSYNSAIIPSLSANLYAWALVKPEFLDGASWNVKSTTDYQMRQPDKFNLTIVMQYWNDSALPIAPTIQSMQNHATTFTKLDPTTCLLTYTSVFGNRSDMIMVASKATSMNNSGNALLAYGTQHRNQWLLGSPLIGNSNTFNADQLDVSYFSGGVAQRAEALAQWNVGGFKIDYCLGSQTTNAQGECSVDYSFSVMLGQFDACKSSSFYKRSLSVEFVC